MKISPPIHEFYIYIAKRDPFLIRIQTKDKYKKHQVVESVGSVFSLRNTRSNVFDRVKEYIITYFYNFFFCTQTRLMVYNNNDNNGRRSEYGRIFFLVRSKLNVFFEINRYRKGSPSTSDGVRILCN